MDASELFGLTARLRRQMPRNADVLALCDEAERLSQAVTIVVTKPVTTVTKPKRDRAAYMREYRSRPI